MSLFRQLTSKQTTQRLLLVLLVGLVAHAVVVTVFNFNNQPLDIIIRSWKELLLLAIIALNVPWAFEKKIWQNPIVKSVIIYGALTLVYALVFWNRQATIVGLRNNLAFLALFTVGLRLWSKDKKAQLLFENVVLWSSVAVVLSVLLEIIWPQAFSSLNLLDQANSGQTIQDSSITRLHGVMSGPLQLGSYMVIPFAIAFERLLKTRAYKYGLLCIAISLAVFATYSRAALGALILVCLIQIGSHYRKHISKKTLIVFAASALVAFMLTVYLALNWQPLSLLVFHAEPSVALSESSTADHVLYAAEGLRRIGRQPLGYGLGAAGPASFFAEKSFNPENHYIQIALEVGVVGLIVFASILFLVGKELLGSPKYFSAFTGLLAMNFLLHTWTDTATAWTAWLIFGIYIGLDVNAKHSAK